MSVAELGERYGKWYRSYKVLSVVEVGERYREW